MKTIAVHSTSAFRPRLGAVLCATCRAFGYHQPAQPCAVCAGTGSFRRLVIPIRVISAADLAVSAASAPFRRLAVMRSEHHKGVVSVCGVTDNERGIEASIAADRFEKVGYVQFVERNGVWAP